MVLTTQTSVTSTSLPTLKRLPLGPSCVHCLNKAIFTAVGKILYSGIGDKTGPYFSLLEMRWMRPFFTYCAIDMW